MNICTFADIKDEIIDFLRNGKLLPLVGSGYSKGSATIVDGVVPSGDEYKSMMIEKLTVEKAFRSETLEKLKQGSFSKVCDFFEKCEKIPDEFKRSFFVKNFKGVLLNVIYKHFLEIEWPYVYTLNFDDAVENNSEFKEVVVANRTFYPKIFDEKKCVIKLHGDVADYTKYKDDRTYRVFTSKEYLASLKANEPLLTKLKHDWFSCNFIIIGCSFEDELDLLSIQDVLPDDENLKNVRRIFISDSEPDEYKMIELSRYNITDVVVSKSYDEFYKDIYDAYIEARKIPLSNIFNYSNVKIVKAQDIENEKYFYFGKNLFDNKRNEIVIPSYFISREIKYEIIANFSKNTIHLVRGNKISGRSYLLFDIYNEFFSSRKTFIFNGISSLNANAFETLLKVKSAVILFDINSITREQFKKLINSYNDIHRNETNIVVILGNNSSDFFGVLKILVMNNSLKDDKIIRYEMNNNFSDTETNIINKKLSRLTIPNFSKTKTILDNLIIASDKMNRKSKFNVDFLTCNSEKEMTFLIILAAKEKITSYDLVFFDISKESYLFMEKYPMLFESLEIQTFEKNASANSQSKVITNSKYWLTRELGNFVELDENRELVINAYKYLVLQCIIKSNDKIEAAKKYKDFILFDVINNTFLQNNNTKRHIFIKLIMDIYANLKDIIAEDYQYMHQYAKSCLHYGRILSDNSKKLEYLNIALNNVKVSQSQLEVILETSKNENLFITLAHIQYTIATIYCDICKAEDYKNKEHISAAIDSVNIAVFSPYNSDDYKRDNNKSIGIKNFIDSLSINNVIKTLDSQQRISWNEILNRTRTIMISRGW